MLSKILGTIKQILPSKSIIQLIEQDFAPLEKHCRGIVQMAVRYIVEGEGEEVLLRIKGIPEAAESMKMTHSNSFNYSPPKENKTRLQLLQNKELTDPALLCRLGKAYQAVWDGFQRKPQYSPVLDNGAEWVEVLLSEMYQPSYIWLGKDYKVENNWNTDFLEAALSAGGLNPDILVRCLLWNDPSFASNRPPMEAIARINGIKGCFARHPNAVREALKQSHSSSRVHALETILKYEADTLPFIEDLTLLAVGDAKKVREMALTVLQKTPAEALERLKAIAESGSNNERFHSIRALSRLGGPDVQSFLEARLETESSAKTQEEITRVLGFMSGKGEEEETPAAEVKFDLPPVPDFPSVIPLSEESKEAFREMVRNINAEARKNYLKWWDQARPEWKKGQPREISDRISHDKVTRAIAYLETGADPKKSTGLLVYERYIPVLMLKYAGQFMGRREISLVHGWRLLNLLNELKNDMYAPLLNPLLSALASPGGDRADLRAHAKACIAAGYTPDRVTNLYFTSHARWDQPPDLPPDAVWPYFAENQGVLEKVLTEGRTGDFSHDYSMPIQRERALKILATFPAIPSRLLTMLWEIALEGVKTERPLAQEALVNDPQRDSRLVKALADPKKDIRTIAAEWLGRVGTEAAIAELKKALAKEKHDEPMAAMFVALERLGAPIEEFLDRERLLDEAVKGLSKGTPKELDWLPLESLPMLHWEKTGEVVPPEIPRWFLVQSCKLGKPEPSPLLREYLALVPKGEREAFGEWVLDAWLSQDVRPRYTHEEASKLAEAEAKQVAAQVKQYPQYYADWNEEEHRKAALNRFLNNCLGSAMPSKGILAMTGACAGPAIVPKVQRYLKQWYGMRAHQCKALIQMLSWVDHPLAIQLILAVGARFRTKGIQNEAVKYAALIAERKGWTPGEMADRTVPTAGFDENGIMEIDYGSRSFTARLGEDFGIVLMNADGREIKSLPDANKAEDEVEIKALKAAFSASKKELKQVLQLQKERLYEAMCTERAWRFEDWDLYLHRHPIVGRYCQRLVWLVERGDKSIASFRPLPDRTLVDYNDEDVACSPDDMVRIAHQTLLPPEASSEWLRHLADYNIEPLFAQFGKEAYQLTEAMKEETEIKDFEGHMTETFRLRSRMGKLGYVRGETGDGGWFQSYVKRFPGLKILAEVYFTGSPLPEENRPVALLFLRFERIRDDSNAERSYMMQSGVPLEKIPAVLLTECWNDIKQAAADGPGFDPEWQKKSEY